jgi:hypothetical protein
VNVLQKVRKTLSPLLDADAFNVVSLRNAISKVDGGGWKPQRPSTTCSKFWRFMSRRPSLSTHRI